MALVTPLSPLEMDLGYIRRTCGNPEMGKKQLEERRKCTKEGAEIHPGVQSALQVLDHLEVLTIIFFGLSSFLG